MSPLTRQPEKFTLAEIVSHLGGELLGDGGRVVRGLASLEKAGEGDVSFYDNPKYKDALNRTRAAAVVINREHANSADISKIIVEEKPRLYTVRLLNLLFPPLTFSAGISPQALVEEGSEVSPDAYVGPFSHIGVGARIAAGASVASGCVVGAGVEVASGACLHHGVVVYPGCVIGRESTLHAGTVIGADGFGYVDTDHLSGERTKVPQVGGVVIGDRVEIGALSAIDRGALEDTVIGDGVKIDNLVQIGHNVRVGRDTVICGCVAIAGSVEIGDECLIGGAVSISGHLKIADRVTVLGGTVVLQAVSEPGSVVGGPLPATDAKDWRKTMFRIRKLDRVEKRIRSLEKSGAIGES